MSKISEIADRIGTLFQGIGMMPKRAEALRTIISDLRALDGKTVLPGAMSSDTPTPRTDAVGRTQADVEMHSIDWESELETLWVDIAFARTLERELAEAKAAYDGLVALLERRFPRNSDGSLPDFKVEDVLAEEMSRIDKPNG